MTHLYLLGDHSEQLLQQKYRKKKLSLISNKPDIRELL